MLWASTAYRIGLGLLVAVALAVQFRHGIGRTGFSAVNFFSYFTNLSNILGAAVLLYCGLTRRRHPVLDYVRGAAVLYLAVTGIVYNLLLRDEGAEGQSLGIIVPWVNVVIHMVMPVAIVVDWLWVPPERPLQTRLALAWLAFPLAYVGYSVVRGAIVDWYPYPFLDPREVGGYGGVAGYSAAIAAAFILLTFAVAAVGNRLRARRGAGRGRPAPGTP